LWPILCFIDEIREYLIAKLRKGQTANAREVAAFIKKKPYLNFETTSIGRVQLRYTNLEEFVGEIYVQNSGIK